MKMRKTAAAGICLAAICTAVSVACTSLVPADAGDSSMCFSVGDPAGPLNTRTVAAFDTNSFILKVVNDKGKSIYDDRYGSRPQMLKVSAGTYEVSLFSGNVKELEFNSPVYGDLKTIVVAPQENVSVSFSCAMRNAGVRFFLSDQYLSKYPSGIIRIRQGSEYLDCPYGDSRFAYLDEGEARFFALEKGVETQIFTKMIERGKMYDLSIDVSSSESRGTFSVMAVDTVRTFISESVTVGDKYNGDGKSVGTAYSVGSARNHIGDTAWVWGYIVAGDLGSGKINFEQPFTSTAHMAIAESPTERTRERCFSVNLTRAALKSALNLKDNPDNIGRKVFVRGVIDSSYLKLNGLNPAFEYEFAK